MPETPEHKRPRLIVPGAEPDAPAGARIVVPGADRVAPDAGDVSTDAPRAPGIVLPPGAARDAGDDLPEYPRLRPVVLMPVSDGQREFLLVSDPMGVLPNQPVLSIDALPLLQLLDGTTSLADLTALLMRETRDLRVSGMVRDFVAQLNELLLLDSPRFQRAYQALRDAYHPLEIRPAALEGRSYPADREELTRFLDAHVAEARTLDGDPAATSNAGTPTATAAPSSSPRPAPSATAAPSATVTRARSAPTPPRALMAPHLDPRRAGAVIARAFLELDAAATPLRVVVFGTGHSLLGDLFALTRKHFETPLGKAVCDTAFVDRVASRLGDLAYRGELSHREEHSIEFQALYLKHRLGERPFTIVPILCGGFHGLLEDDLTPRESPEFERLIEAVREAEHELGGTTMYLAGVDLSHVGPRFGDPPTDARVKQETEATDRAALEAALTGNAEGWFEAIAAHDDATRICGFAATYALLRCAEPRDGRLLHYRQCDEPDGTIVTVAAAVWH